MRYMKKLLSYGTCFSSRDTYRSDIPAHTRSHARALEKLGRSLHGLAQRVAKGRYPSIHVKYSRNLRDLISRMLSTSPAQRPDLDQVRLLFSSGLQARPKTCRW